MRRVMDMVGAAADARRESVQADLDAMTVEAAARAAVVELVVDGSGAVLPCPWTVSELLDGPETWADFAGRLTPSGYRLVLTRPLEGELVRWQVRRDIPETGSHERCGHVVIGRRGSRHDEESQGEPIPGLVFLVVS